jgi:hypothetical protein
VRKWNGVGRPLLRDAATIAFSTPRGSGCLAAGPFRLAGATLRHCSSTASGSRKTPPPDAGAAERRRRELAPSPSLAVPTAPQAQRRASAMLRSRSRASLILPARARAASTRHWIGVKPASKCPAQLLRRGLCQRCHPRQPAQRTPDRPCGRRADHRVEVVAADDQLDRVGDDSRGERNACHPRHRDAVNATVMNSIGIIPPHLCAAPSPSRRAAAVEIRRPISVHMLRCRPAAPYRSATLRSRAGASAWRAPARPARSAALLTSLGSEGQLKRLLATRVLLGDGAAQGTVHAGVGAEHLATARTTELRRHEHKESLSTRGPGGTGIPRRRSAMI